MRMSLILLVFTLFIGFSSATVSLISPDRPTYDPTVAVTNFNQFKTNLDSKLISKSHLIGQFYSLTSLTVTI